MRITASGISNQSLTVLGILAVLWIASVNPGSLGTDDTARRLTMAHAWWTHTPQIPQGLSAPTSRKDIDHGVPDAQGRRVMFYDPGQSLLMLPADWLGTHVSGWIHARDPKGVRVWFVELLTFLPLNLLLVLTCCWLMQLLGFSGQLSAPAALIWLLGTTVLPYASVSFQNNQVSLFLFLSIALILHNVKKDGAFGLIGSGLAIGMAVLLRTSAVIHAFTCLLLLVLCIREQTLPVKESVRRVALWGLGASVPILAGRLYDLHRFGHFFVTGQSQWLKGLSFDPLFLGAPPLPPDFPFNHHFYEGILGALFSPAKSLFVYDPLILPCLVAGFIVWKHLSRMVRWVTLLALLDLALHLGLTSKLDFWHGDWAWGSRYHLTSIHLLLAALLPVLIQRMLTLSTWRASLIVLMVLFSIGVQLVSVAMPADLEVAKEELTAPVQCDLSEWNSKLEFRLGQRVEDLYCFATGGEDVGCPLHVAAVAEAKYPECRPMANGLRSANRLAFFPFNTEHRIWGRANELRVWLCLVGLAAGGTLVWLIWGVRDVRRRVLPVWR
jgi:hypothetical protein